MQSQKGKSETIQLDSKRFNKKSEETTEQHLQRINEELYSRNAELAVRNKTLSLLRDLYNITIATLATEQMGKQAIRTIRKGLNFELVGLFMLNQKNNFLTPIAFSTSERARNVLPQLEEQLFAIQIPLTDATNICNQAITMTKRTESTLLYDAWKPTDAETLLQQVRSACNIHSVVVFPLRNDKGVLGVLLLSFNRTYEDLARFEQESIESIIDVITIALDKSLLYEELRIVNAKLRELDTAKSEFMSIASHQLRTPLAGIIGYLSMLLEGDYGKLGSEEQRVMKEVFEAGQRLVRLVNTFLNVTRIEAGRLSLNPHPVNLVEEVAADIRQLKPPADAKGVQLVFKPAEESIIAEVDADKLRDAFLNLIDNGIKYAPKGIVTVTLAREGTDHIRFSAHDTGVGIDPRETANLFQKFVRGTGIARIQPDGSGLGLFIVKKLVEAHRGKVWVESEGLNKGSTFHVVLPTRQPQPSAK